MTWLIAPSSRCGRRPAQALHVAAPAPFCNRPPRLAAAPALAGARERRQTCEKAAPPPPAASQALKTTGPAHVRIEDPLGTGARRRPQAPARKCVPLSRRSRRRAGRALRARTERPVQRLGRTVRAGQGL